jgi:hypothetical protein
VVIVNLSNAHGDMVTGHVRRVNEVGKIRPQAVKIGKVAPRPGRFTPPACEAR